MLKIYYSSLVRVDEIKIRMKYASRHGHEYHAIVAITKK